MVNLLLSFSHQLKLFRSEFLSNLLLNTNFKEGAAKVAKLDLIFYSGMCGLDCLQKAVTSNFEENLSKTNVFKIFEILKKNELESEEVKNFVVNNFDTNELLQNGILDMFPEFAVSILKKDAAMKNHESKNIFILETTTLKGPNTGPIVQIGPNTSINECINIIFKKLRFIYGIIIRGI